MESKDDETKANELSLVEWSSAAVEGRSALITHQQSIQLTHKAKTFALLAGFIGLFVEEKIKNIL